VQFVLLYWEADKMVYILLVDGYEDTEMIAPLDMLSRGNIPVTRVGVMGKKVTSKLGIVTEADITADDVDFSDCEMVFLPGGPGTHHYYEKPIVDQALAYAVEHDCYLAAICAAPSVLAAKGLLSGKKACCHYSVKEKMEDAQLQNQPVCVDGKIITGCGAGASIDFGLTLVALLRGQETADAIKHSIGV
jgi:4-methyl-5(b-hydroxyethyl)-thiazole monophosphate biosynthesis